MMIDQDVRTRLAAEVALQNREMKELSLASGLGETYVRDVIKRGRGKIENLVFVARELGKPPEWLFSGEQNSRPTPAGPSPDRPAPNARDLEPAPRYGSPLDVIGVSRGGADGRLIFNGEVIESIPRPAMLEGVDGAYACYVVGDSMRPRFKEGDRVWVHPRRPPRKGDDVIVQLLATEEDEPPEGYIKEYVSFSGSDLVLTQHNPVDELRFTRARVKSVHVIVGALYL